MPNERGLERALCAGGRRVRRGEPVPVRERDTQPQERQPVGRGVARGAGARGRAARGTRGCAARGSSRCRSAALTRATCRWTACSGSHGGLRMRGARRSRSATRLAWRTRSRCVVSSSARVSELPGAELTAHFHNTRGQGLANVLAALESGVDSFESSFGSSAAVRCRGARPATSPPRISSRCCTRWAWTPGSTSSALLGCARARAGGARPAALGPPAHRRARSTGTVPGD